MAARYILITFFVLAGITSFKKNSHQPWLVKKCNDFTIDGKGSSPEWNKTEWQKFMKISKDGVEHESKSKVLYSSKGIYVLFSGADQLITTKDYKDYQEIYEGDVFESFFIPAPTSHSTLNMK